MGTVKGTSSRTLIVGLGNPIVTDDGVGPRVAAELRSRISQPGVTIREASVGGLGLLDLVVGYDRAIIIDAIQTSGGRPGQIYRIDPADFDGTRHAASPHDAKFSTALKYGKKVGKKIPRRIDVFAIEAVDVTTFHEGCTPEVERAIPKCVELILEELKEEAYA